MLLDDDKKDELNYLNIGKNERNNIMKYTHRYPWDGTTRSTYQSNYKYTSPYSNSLASTTATTMSSLATSHYTTAPTPYTRFTYSTVSNFITDDYHKKYSYGYSNDYNNHKNNNNNAYTTATTRKTNTWDYSRTYNSKDSNSPNDVNYRKVTPYRYKSTVKSTSLATTSTTGAQYSAPKSYGHGKDSNSTRINLLPSSLQNSFVIISLFRS